MALSTAVRVKLVSIWTVVVAPRESRTAPVESAPAYWFQRVPNPPAGPTRELSVCVTPALKLTLMSCAEAVSVTKAAAAASARVSNLSAVLAGDVFGFLE